jgi:SecD/SecF GG Motif.
MQGKGLITIIAIVLGLICINELLPTWYVNKKEKEIAAARGNEKEIARNQKRYIKSGFHETLLHQSKEKEMKLGLDLKGGINLLLEINQRDLVNNFNQLFYPILRL